MTDYSKYLAALAELLHRIDLSARSDNTDADKQAVVDAAVAGLQAGMAQMPPIIFMFITPTPAP